MSNKIEFIDAEEPPESNGTEGGVDEAGVADKAALPSTAGARLRHAREKKGVDLSHVAAETRIPMRHLEAIEAGEYDTLPSRTYAIGFAKNYARAVDLDREEIADMVRAELAEGDPTQVRSAGAMEPGDPAKLPSSGLVWFGAIAALILAVGVIAFYSTYFGAGSGPPPIAAEMESEGATPGDNAASEQVAAATPSEDGPVVFTAIEDNVWVRLYEPSGERLYEATMQEGDAFEIPTDAENPLINTGRPHLLEITIDGQDVAKLADEQTTLGDVPVSASALLERAEAPEDETGGVPDN